MTINNAVVAVLVSAAFGYVTGHTVHKIKVMQHRQEQIQVPIKMMDMNCYEALSGDILCENEEYACVWTQDEAYSHILNVSCINIGGTK